MSTALALLTLIAGACCAAIAWSMPDAPAADVGTLLATGLGLLGAAIGAVSLRRRAAGLGVLRWFAYSIALAAISQILLGGEFALGAFLLRLGASIGVAGLALPARARIEPVLRSTPMRIVDLLLGSVLILAVGSEVGLRIFAWVAPAPLFERPATEPSERVKMYSLRPGGHRFGFPASPEGFYDAPFTREDGERAVLVVGGSACVGVVPHALTFTTIAEQRLPDTAVWNCGVPDTGPIEYLHLLTSVGLPSKPDRAIVVIAVADGFRRAATFRDRRPVRDALAGWLDLRNVMLAVVPRRLSAMLERRKALGRDPRREVIGDDRPIVGPEAIAEAFPWTRDPSLEQPTFDDDAWLARAREQVAYDVRVTKDAGLFRVLDACRDACRDANVPFAVVVLPAAWQVDDVLWRQVAGDADKQARDRPQLLLNAWATMNGVAMLDVLPFLRATPPMQDGHRHLFHRNDDNLNARGNRLVGDALAGFIERLRAEERR